MSFDTLKKDMLEMIELSGKISELNTLLVESAKVRKSKSKDQKIILMREKVFELRVRNDYLYNKWF